MKRAILIQARTGSTRLPNKVILPFYNNQNCLEILIDNLKKTTNTPIIVVTTTNKKDDAIVNIAKTKSISFFRGEEENVLKRFLDCACHFSLSEIIRVCSDNPFLDMNELKELEKSIDNQSEYISFKISEKPSILTHYGFWAEYITKNSLERVLNYTQDKLYLEHVTNFIYNNEDRFKTKWLNFDIKRFNDLNFRLTLDTREDFDNLTSLYKILKEKDKTIIIENIVHELLQNETLVINMNLEINKNTK